MTKLNYTDLPSPNFDSRADQAIDMLVLHYTGMRTASEALERLCDVGAKVSAHYVVDEDGTVYRLVPEESRAWHAGVSSWRGNTNINQRSIGIEIVNPGHEFGYRPFPAAQMEAVTALCKDILSRRKIPARNVVAHSDVAPARKEDPGELFDWNRLAAHKVGLMPKEMVARLSWWQIPFDLLGLAFRLENSWSGWYGHSILPNRKNRSLYALATGPLPSDAELQAQLASYGYDTTDLPKAITAFQRHFFPAHLTGIWDHECAVRLASLLSML